MPIIPKQSDLDKRLKTQLNCKLCDEESVYNQYKIICDLCSSWICMDCSELSEDLYKLAKVSKYNLKFFCSPCEEELPRLREMVNLKQKQEEMEEEMNHMKTDIAENKQAITKKDKEHEIFIRRLNKLEQDMEQHGRLTDEEYPKLTAINVETKQLRRDIMTQQQQATKIDAVLKKQTEDKEEEKRRDSKKSNLIVYGIPEDKTDEAEQMLTDFNTLKELYNDRVEINKRDISTISRIGVKKPEQIRP